MPVIVSAEKSISPELAQSLTKLYDSSPEFSGGAEAIDKAQEILASDGLVYVGWFNGKAVSAIMASGTNAQRLIHNIVVHPANRGRGIADRHLRAIGERPTKSCSKYCIGMAAMGEVGRYNRFLPTMRKLGMIGNSPALGRWSEIRPDLCRDLSGHRSILTTQPA